MFFSGDAYGLSFIVEVIVIFVDSDEGARHLGLATDALGCVKSRVLDVVVVVVSLSNGSGLKGYTWCDDVLKLSTAALLMSELCSFSGGRGWLKGTLWLLIVPNSEVELVRVVLKV